jgi:hypothetical protein
LQALLRIACFSLLTFLTSIFVSVITITNNNNLNNNNNNKNHNKNDNNNNNNNVNMGTGRVLEEFLRSDVEELISGGLHPLHPSVLASLVRGIPPFPADRCFH